MRSPYKPMSREDAQAALTTFLLAKTCQEVQEVKTELGKLKIKRVVPESSQAALSEKKEMIECGPGGLTDETIKKMAERDVMFYEMFSRLAGLMETFVNANPAPEAREI